MCSNFIERLKIFRFYFAIVGWTVSAVAHLFSIADIIIPYSSSQAVVGLFFGLMIMFFSSYLDDNENEYDSKASTLLFSWPLWLNIFVIGCFAYSSISFLWVLHISGGFTAENYDGQYYLMNHSETIRKITLSEYNHFLANDVRGTMGHFMGFYALFVGFFYPGKNTGCESTT